MLEEEEGDMQHLDEGTIHAWLDGQLPREEAEAVDAHVAECRQCADAVAEARGLIAASSRILTGLDAIPRDVAPKQAPTIAAVHDVHAPAPSPSPSAGVSPAPTAPPRRTGRRWLRGGTLAAAATIVVAVGTLTLMRASERGGLASLAPESAADMAGRSAVAAVSADSSPMPLSAPVTPPAVPQASAPSVAGNPANEVAVATTSARRRALADAAGAASQAPVEARDAQARVDSPPTAERQALSQKARDEADGRRELSKVAGRDVAAAPPQPDTVSVRIIRGTAKVEEQRFSVASIADSSAKAVATGSIRGRVVDGNNTGIPGVMVRVEGTSIGVTTSQSGEFDLSGVPSGAQRLRVAIVGFVPTTRTVTVRADDPTSVDFTLTPSSVALSEMVVTGAEGRARNVPAQTPARAAPAPAPAAPSAPELLRTRPAPSIYGCYELGITPASTQARSGFLRVPRRIALDSIVAPARSDGVWYQVRDLVTGDGASGVWRPAGPEAIEVQWTYGTRTATVRLTGAAGSMLRGSVEEIDRATANGEAGTVVAVRRSCAATAPER